LEKIKGTFVNKPALLLVIILLCFSLLLLVAPTLAPYDPLKVEMGQRLLPISYENWLGTDHMGRDIFSRLLVGAQTTVGATFLILALSLTIGILLGLISGYAGGMVDRILMRLVDALLAFPDYIVAIVICGLLGPGISNLIIAVVIVRWVKYTRLVRGTVLSVKHSDYIAMARVNGMKSSQILRKHVFPHVVGNVLVLATLDIGKTILLIASLSYIGLGIQPPYPEWGSMLNEGNAFFHNAPQLMIIPGISIVIVVLFFNLLGDKLRDYFDVNNQQGGL
jgi:peptide/nickel transport system permease protein